MSDVHAESSSEPAPPSQSGEPTPPKRLLEVLGKLALSLLVTLLLLVIAEGTASFIWLARDLDESGVTLAEHRHTRFDPLLGWINEPSVSIPDMYGPGLPLHINSQGFRATRDYSTEVPNGRLRILCSGDSFTLGYGVGDQQTWASQLEQLEPKLETVNMGQGGYGVDQAYLWYARDGAKLEHDVQLFAFITGDFLRARRALNYGLPKPVLALNDGELEPRGVPLSRLPFLFPYFVHNRKRFSELNILRLVNDTDAKSAQARGIAMTEEQLREVCVAMFRELKRINEERGSQLIAVHLPGEKDVKNENTKSWVSFLDKELSALEIPYFNLVEDLGEVKPTAVRKLFLQEEQVDFPGAAGHFTDAGNEWAAERVLERLMNLPTFSAELATR